MRTGIKIKKEKKGRKKNIYINIGLDTNNNKEFVNYLPMNVLLIYCTYNINDL